MSRYFFLLVIVGLVVSPSGVVAQDAYTIKLKESATGDRIRVEKQATEKTKMKLEDAQGTSVRDNEEMKSERYTYEDSILKKKPGERRPTRLRRHYDLAETKTGADTQTLPYQGKSVLIEKRGDTYHFQIEGGAELQGKDAEALNKEFNKPKGELDFNKILVPNKPVHVNESWNLDADALVKDLQKDMPVEIDTSKTKATAKLLKAYKQDGRQFGAIELHLEFPLTALVMGDTRIGFAEGAKFTADATMTGCIDGSLNSGSTKFRGQIDGRADLAQGGMNFKMLLAATMTGQESEREIGKK
jgi:hypothetical protein